MADKVQLDVEVGGVEQSIKSVKDLKQAIKDAKDEQLKAAAAFGEGSKEFIEASKNVSKLKDKVEDLNDSTQSLKGSGIERASQGFNQLGEGLRNLDFDKVKVGLTAVKSALAATGIMLLVQGVTYLIQNFDELSKGSGIIAKALRFVGDIITSVKDTIYEFTDAIGLTNSALDKMGDSIVENADKAKEALSSQTAEYDRQIAVAKASGKSAVELEKAKQQAIIDTNKALVEQTIAYVRNGGELDDEKKKLLTSQLNAIKGAVNDQKIIDINDKKEQLDRHKKLIEDKKKADDDALKKSQDDYAFYTSQKDFMTGESNKFKIENEKTTGNEIKIIQTTLANDSIQSANETEAEIARVKQLERQKDFQNKMSDLSKGAEIASKSTQSLMILTDAYFSYKRSKADKGSEQDLALAKKQFNFNKGLQLGLAAIDGFKSITSSLAQSPIAIGPIPNPAGIASLAFAIATTGASILKIASTKFDGGAGSAPSTSAPSAPSLNAPTINTPSANTNTNTSFDEQGRNISNNNTSNPSQTINVNVKAQVVESEMTEKQDRAITLKERSTF